MRGQCQIRCTIRRSTGMSAQVTTLSYKLGQPPHRSTFSLSLLTQSKLVVHSTKLLIARTCVTWNSISVDQQRCPCLDICRQLSGTSGQSGFLLGWQTRKKCRHETTTSHFRYVSLLTFACGAVAGVTRVRLSVFVLRRRLQIGLIQAVSQRCTRTRSLTLMSSSQTSAQSRPSLLRSYTSVSLGVVRHLAV